MPEMYLVVLYFIFGGFLIPSFGDFDYYFLLDEERGPGISKFTYSLLGIIGQVTGIIGSFWYERNLKQVEVRTILFWGTLVSIVSSFCSYIFAMRWNLEVGISDMVFIILTNTVFGVVALAMNVLPTLSLFARITPKGIEGTHGTRSHQACFPAWARDRTGAGSGVASRAQGRYLSPPPFKAQAAELTRHYR